MEPLIVIPARGGSKGIPYKNVKDLCGKPLIQYTIDAAISYADGKDVIVSTDSETIKAVAEKCGAKVPFLRPSQLASDEAGTREVLLHALETMDPKGSKYDVVLLLQPTSPLRTAEDIRLAEKLYSDKIDMVVSVTLSNSNPYYNLFETDGSGYLVKSKPGNYTRRQDCPNVYAYNGAIYFINPKTLRDQPLSAFSKIIPYNMPEERSLDLDTKLDWKLAEYILSETT